MRQDQSLKFRIDYNGELPLPVFKRSSTMAVINKLENTASVVYNGSTILSDPVSTVLLLPPVVIKSVGKQISTILSPTL